LIVRAPDAIDAGFGAMRETDRHALLTPREIEVLAALAEGMTNKAIARRLNISLHTVKFHVESVFRKLGARTRTEAVAKASETPSLRDHHAVTKFDLKLRCWRHVAKNIRDIVIAERDFPRRGITSPQPGQQCECPRGSG